MSNEYSPMGAIARKTSFNPYLGAVAASAIAMGLIRMFIDVRDATMEAPSAGAFVAAIGFVAWLLARGHVLQGRRGGGVVAAMFGFACVVSYLAVRVAVDF